METLVKEKQKNFLDKDEMLLVLQDIDTFTETPEFAALIKELRSLPTREEKKLFVRNIIINKDEQKKRGINPPDGILIQRSYFTDNRPTLFCVVKYLKDGKRKMTITYDDDNNFES
jgi:hypothetical protein